MGTTAQKLQRVLDTKEGLKDTINTYLGQNITSAIPFKDYETYIKNFYGSLPKTPYAEGSNITLSNTLKGKLDYDNGVVGIGQTEQDSTQGYQLLNVNFANTKVNGIDFTNSNQVVGIKGTTTASANIEVDRATLPSGNYIITCSNMPYAWGTSRIEVSGTGIDTLSFFSGNTQKQLTLSQETTIIFRAIVSGTGTSVDYSTTIMLESGTTAHDWEQYTGGIPSPSPNWEQEIKYVRGKNIYDKSKVYRPIATQQNVNNDFENLEQGELYTFSTGNHTWATVLTYDSANNRIRTLGNTATSKEVQFTPTSQEVKFVTSFYVGGSVETKDVDFTGVQLEKGSATSYLPYNTIEEVVSGKNLLEAKLNTVTNNGITVTNNNDGTFTINGTNTSTSVVTFRLDEPNFHTYEDGTYTLDKGTTNTDIFIRLMQNETWAQIITVSYDERLKSQAITNATNTFIYIGIKGSTTINNVTIKPMFVKGSYTVETIGNFEPYITPTSYQLSLGDKKLYDECYIVGSPDNWKFVEWHEKIMLKNLSWIRNGTGTSGKYRYYTTDVSSTIEKTTGNNQKTTKGLYSNILKETNADQNFLLLQGICSSPNGQLYVYIKSVSEEADTTALINLLTSTNAYAVIPLAQAKETPITDATLIEQLNNWYYSQSNNGTTILESNGDLPMIIKVRGLKGE